MQSNDLQFGHATYLEGDYPLSLTSPLPETDSDVVLIHTQSHTIAHTHPGSSSSMFLNPTASNLLWGQTVQKGFLFDYSLQGTRRNFRHASTLFKNNVIFLSHSMTFEMNTFLQYTDPSYWQEVWGPHGFSTGYPGMNGPEGLIVTSVVGYETRAYALFLGEATLEFKEYLSFIFTPVLGIGLSKMIILPSMILCIELCS